MKKLSFVIPCYGSEQTIESVVSSIIAKVAERNDYDYEIVAVNDKSPDNVIEVLFALSEKNPKIKVLDFAKNVGKHTAVLAGYAFTKGDYVVTLDDDGQCPIENLWELIKPLEEGHDMAMAKYEIKQEKGYKKFGSFVNHLASRLLLNKPKDLIFTNFIARQNYICKAMAEYQNVFPYLEGLSLRITRDIVQVPMQEHQRLAGHSNFTFKKSLALWMNGFTAFSTMPLRIATIIGFSTACIGFLFGIITILRKLFIPGISVGYSSLLVAILFCSGLIMLTLGLIGEYLGRVYITVNHYPQYVVRRTANIDDKKV